jgi:hypothetical protein
LFAGLSDGELVHIVATLGWVIGRLALIEARRVSLAPVCKLSVYTCQASRAIARRVSSVKTNTKYPPENSLYHIGFAMSNTNTLCSQVKQAKEQIPFTETLNHSPLQVCAIADTRSWCPFSHSKQAAGEITEPLSDSLEGLPPQVGPVYLFINT